MYILYMFIYLNILPFTGHNCDVSPEQNAIIHKPFNYSNVQSDTLCWQTVG